MSELQFSYWIEQGRRIGLEGNGLGEWATRKYEAGLQREENKEQERQEREEKKEKERQEREEKKEKERQEREERAKERELRKYEIDRSLEERRLALEEAKLALDKQRIDDGIQESTAPKVSGIKPPRLLPYNEDEDITAYIIRFESVASLCKWPVSEWTTRLALLFSGTALNIYSTLSEEEIADYVSLKAAVLRAFKRTPEQYRKEFRFAKMSSKINFSQFMTQLFRHFDYWFHSSDVDDSFENLREFIVVDQFLTVLPHDIRLFIKEQELWKAKDVAEAADRFAGAHRCYPGDKQTQKKSPNPKPSPVVTQRPTPLCYVCGEAGHMARSCPKGKAAMTSTPGTSSNKAGSNKVGRYASKETHSRAPFTHGVVNGSRVSTILRDTGCSTCIVSKDLFPNLNERELPKSSLIDYLGRENVFPVLPVYIGCKWFTGKVNAIIAPIKFCTVLLGNIEGALFPEDGDCPPLNSIDEEPRRNHLPTEKGKAIENVNITTRSASRKVVHPLVFPDVEALETTPIDFIKLQNECATLESIRKDCQANTITKNSKVEYRNRLEETSKIAQENIKTSMEIYSTYFDKKSTRRQFKVNDEVLLLLPTEHNKLLVEWQGPFKVLRKLNSVDYIIDVKGKPKTFHVNLLKAYFYRSQNVLSVADENLNSSISDYCCVTSHVIVLSEDIEDPIPCVEEEITSELDICPTLTPEQKGKLEEVLDNFSEVFSEIPGCTSTIMHKIELTSTEPIRKKMYPVPAHLKEEVCKEVDKLLKLGIIEESKSDYCNPIVMIKKPDNTFRLALDFRALNSVTKFDSEPMPSIDEDLFKFRNMSFITELDITKAYHQVMLDPNARPLTAFPTYRGLMQYKRLPFGLVTACATYVRLMKKIFQGMNHISIYFDNIFVMSNTFQEHLETLSEVLRRLRDHGLTARPSKCHFCYEKVKYLGFEVEINKPFVLRTDASSVGLGAVLLQYDEETAYPVAYASRKLLPREQRYSTIERECLAIFWAVRKFHYYLYGKEFFIETDHKPLTYMETLKSGNDRILRLILGLQPYKYRIIYISGQSNHFSDLLSRSN
ncbi:uncharacterized protein [Palaemon carinicauda]|uniref:uncharacterized protein n=1 Tax=Palaemon carinicauda TaxID=392227 RepID=UPI0035B61BCD